VNPVIAFPALERVVGHLVGQAPGPLIVTIGGLHGNEPAGVTASRRVLDKLRKYNPRFRGEYLALAGNIPALKAGKRYIDEDLNRIWLPERLHHPAPGKNTATTIAATSEEAERVELLTEIQTALGRAPNEAYFLDLHSTSASGSAFSVFADTLHNRRLAAALPSPMVLGLEEHLQGTLLNYINELGFAAVGFEGGQHLAPSTVDTHELGIWKTLVVAGCLRTQDIPQFPSLLQTAQSQTRGLPRVVEIRYRHDILPGEEFVMKPGFENLDPVRNGDLLAHDRHGEIRSLETGHILMPLYQSQGNDGFFLVRRVRPFWLRLSAWLRAIGAGNVLQYLPGVQRRGNDTLTVNSKIARWFVVEIFHLLGFRRQRPENGIQVFTRRRETP
jgi:succinylglutamate desuccinylase